MVNPAMSVYELINKFFKYFVNNYIARQWILLSEIRTSSLWFIIAYHI